MIHQGNKLPIAACIIVAGINTPLFAKEDSDPEVSIQFGLLLDVSTRFYRDVGEEDLFF